MICTANKPRPTSRPNSTYPLALSCCFVCARVLIVGLRLCYRIMKELRSLDKKATINVDRFRAFVTNHPALLFPAFQMQLALRQHVLGVRFWERCAQKRIKLVDGRRVTLGKLLEMNVHEDAYLSVLEAHEQVVQEEKQAKMAAYQQSRYANKHPQQAASLTASQKVRAKSIIDWIGLKRQFSALKDDAGLLSSQKYASASRDNPFDETDPRHGAGAASKPAHGKVHPQHEGNANSNLLHPHDEMALLVLQVTGTHHYRRIWTQHHLKGSPSAAAPPSASASVQTATNSLDHEDGDGQTTRKRKTHRIAPELSSAAAATPPPTAGPVIGGPASSLPVFVAPPLLSLSSPATAVASAEAGNDGHDEGDSSKAANNLSGPPSTQLYQMLLQGDALQRQHKFVELGNDPKAAKKKAAQAATTPSDETDASSSAHASPNNGPRPAAASESATSTPRKSQVQKTATTLMDLSSATPPPTNSRNRKEILQWQAKVVEQSGILQHVATLQQHSGALSPSPGSARRGSDPLVSHSSHDPPSGRRSSNPHPHAHQKHGHQKHGASHGGVRLIGALAGDDVVSPRVAILQHQLHQQHAHMQAQQQQAVLEDYLGPGGSRHGSRRSSLQK